MSILDFIKNKPAAPSAMDQALGMDTEAQLRSQLDPRNLSMGERLSLMGQAMHAAGSGQGGAEAFRKLGASERARKDGIRQRFQQLQDAKRLKARDERGDFVSDRGYNLNVAKADQAQSNADRTYDYTASQDIFKNNMSMQKYLDGVNQTDYNRGRDDLLDTRYNDQTIYNRGQDTLKNNRAMQTYLDGVDQTNYNRNRDTILDTRALDKTNYDRNQDILANNRNMQTYLDGRGDVDYKRQRDAASDAQIGDNFVFDDTGGSFEGHKNIVAMDAAGNPKTIRHGDPTYNYYASQIKAKEAAAKAKLEKGQKFAPDGTLLLPGQIAQDKAFAKDLENQRPAVAAANVAALSGIADKLASGNSDVGTGFDSIISMIDPKGDLGVRAILGQEGLDVQQRVEGIVQQSLRETLGAQFTQTEAFALISRAYNPRLPAKTNSKRLKVAANIAQKLIEMKQAKADYFTSTGGTLHGYKANLENMIPQMEAQLRAVYNETEQQIDPSMQSAIARSSGSSSGAASSGTSGTTSSGTSWSISP